MPDINFRPAPIHILVSQHIWAYMKKWTHRVDTHTCNKKKNTHTVILLTSKTLTAYRILHMQYDWYLSYSQWTLRELGAICLGAPEVISWLLKLQSEVSTPSTIQGLQSPPTVSVGFVPSNLSPSKCDNHTVDAVETASQIFLQSCGWLLGMWI